jgi:hypothetical protein
MKSKIRRHANFSLGRTVINGIGGACKESFYGNRGKYVGPLGQVNTIIRMLSIHNNGILITQNKLRAYFLLG